MRNKVRAVSSLPIAFVQTHFGSLVALRFDSSIFLIGTEVPVVSSPRTVYDVHILIWVPLHKPHHPLDRYYTIAEPGLCTYGVRARPAPGSEEAPLQHIQIPALGERKQCVLITEGGLCVRKRGLFLVIISLNVHAILAFSNSKWMTNSCVSPHHNHSVQKSGIRKSNQLPF